MLFIGKQRQLIMSLNQLGLHSVHILPFTNACNLHSPIMLMQIITIWNSRELQQHAILQNGHTSSTFPCDKW